MKVQPALPVIYDSTRRGSAVFEELREALIYHHLIWQLVRRDILARYKRSFLGVAWTMLNPLGMMLVWTIAFSQFFKSASLPSYPAYVLSGLLAWTFFSQTTTASMVNLIWGGGLLNRIYISSCLFCIGCPGYRPGESILVFGTIISGYAANRITNSSVIYIYSSLGFGNLRFCARRWLINFDMGCILSRHL